MALIRSLQFVAILVLVASTLSVRLADAASGRLIENLGSTVAKSKAADHPNYAALVQVCELDDEKWAPSSAGSFAQAFSPVRLRVGNFIEFDALAGRNYQFNAPPTGPPLTD
jgi:hypothetical protein